ncbi:MAG: FkbM family methyltransferase [Bacteroidota bacterium]
MISTILKKFVRKGGSYFYGRTPRIHRIPFGPNRGRNIFISFDISPRMYFGIDEPWIAELAQTKINYGDVVYDIGAHIGYTCLLFAQRVGKTGFVHAFEILPSVAEGFLRKTIQANDFNNVMIHAVGLSSMDKTLELAIGATMMASLYSNPIRGDKMELCKTVRLDQYVMREKLPLPSLIKIDIECAEIDCLQGGIEIIKKCRPLLIIEFHNLDLLIKGYNILNSEGYRLITRKNIIDEKFLQSINYFHESVFCDNMIS